MWPLQDQLHGGHRFPVQIVQALRVQEKPTKETGNIKGFGVVEYFAGWLVGWVQTELVLLEARLPAIETGE